MPYFLDANIPIYAGGRPHPLREPCREILLSASRNVEQFVTDAEVLQEMLHHYMGIRAGAQGRDQISDFAEVMRGRVESVLLEDVQLAVSLSANSARLQARDLVHRAVMHRLGVRHIISADRGFDGIPDIERLDPAQLAEWRETLLQ